MGRPPPTATSGARGSPGKRRTGPTSSAAPSTSQVPSDPAGAVDVCVAVHRLSLDRPFTYQLPAEAEAGVGSLVSVPFHGRTVKGWVLGPAAEMPEGRLLPVRKVVSPVRFFDDQMLALLRWVSHRYIAPLSTVIERSHPPRVVSEERALLAEAVFGAGFPPASRDRSAGPPRASAPLPVASPAQQLPPGTVTWVRPLPGREADECIQALRACLAAGRRAIVIVPEAEPVPYTARAVLEELGDRAISFLGGDSRQRYRAWLGIRCGRYDVVVGTRPAVFAPMAGLGLVWVSRDVHPGHREDRSPYYHTREVATARAELQRASCVVAALSPSVEIAAGVLRSRVGVKRPSRQEERRAAPLVETTAPEAEDRSPRLARLVRQVRSAALIVSRSGYGVARVCRSCGHEAACALCRGELIAARGEITCRACGAPGRCANCGSERFGLERAGTERIAQWAKGVAKVPVVLSSTSGPPDQPGEGRIVVGTAAAVKDVGPRALDLVAVLDPDRALGRPGIHAGERAVASWMEAAAWARSRTGGGRVLAQTRQPGHPALQALVRWDPMPFLRHEADERSRAGFPAGHPVFRLEGTPELEASLERLDADTKLFSGIPGGTVCLVAVRPEALAAFRL
ncbi:MAG TPA: hypothetical protein VF972_03045, partial [Actinomycetota bacterium]